MSRIDSSLETALSIGTQSPEASVLRVLVELGVQVADADEGSLLVLDPATNELVFSMVVGVEESALIGKRLPVGKGLTGLAAVTREVQIGAPTYVVGQETKGGAGPRAVIAAPMLVRDACIGVITAVSFREEKRFGAREASLYAKLAAVAGVLVQQRRALERAEREALEREEIDTSERRIARSLLNLSRSAPAAMVHVASMLESIEAIERAARGEDDQL
ncbi:MAG: GAF domain-containing protein [Myxococcales bacterium]|nr:GAF domain-containing protein [Myxococcales bacterium]